MQQARRSSLLALKYSEQLTVVQRLRHRVLLLVTGKWFDPAIVTVILVNTVTLAMGHHGASAAFNQGLSMCNYVFTVVFAMEMVLKLTAFGLK